MFIKEKFVDVSKEGYQPLVAAHKPEARDADDTNRFGYLWDDELLRQRQGKSFLLASDEASQSVNAAPGIAPIAGEDTELLLTIEDRFRELAESVELTHGSYYQREEDIERIAKFLERDLVETSAKCLEELRELPEFGQRFDPTYPVVFLTLLLVGLKFWGAAWVASWPWIAVLSPYLTVKMFSVIHALRVDERKADYIRQALSCEREDGPPMRSVPDATSIS